MPCFYCPDGHLHVKKKISTYLLNFPNAPDHFCPNFSMPKYCSISIKFSIGVFWVTSYVFFSQGVGEVPFQITHFSFSERLLWNFVCNISDTLQWKIFSSYPEICNWKIFSEIRKKIKKTQFELSIWVIKRQVHFFQKICARATRGKHFSGDKQKCGNEFFLMLLELELENKPLKCKKKWKINFLNLDLVQKVVN